MKNCRVCKYSNPQLPCHCFKLGRLLDDDEYYNDKSCDFYKNKYSPNSNNKYEPDYK